MHTNLCYNGSKVIIMSTTFILVRHGEPRYDEIQVDEKHGIAWDFGRLTDEGVKQARSRAQDPRFADAELILSSPYTRALETAANIASYTGLDVRVENDLHEWSPDLTFKNTFGPERLVEMKKIQQEYFESMGERPEDSIYHWESMSDVKKRVLAVLERYTSYRKVIVVCHGIVINSVTKFRDPLDFCDTREITL